MSGFSFSVTCTLKYYGTIITKTRKYELIYHDSSTKTGADLFATPLAGREVLVLFLLSDWQARVGALTLAL